MHVLNQAFTSTTQSPHLPPISGTTTSSPLKGIDGPLSFMHLMKVRKSES